MARLKFIGWLFISIFLFLGLGLAHLNIIQGKRYLDLSQRNCIRLLPQSGARGMILDRNGEVIVGNKLTFNVMVLPQDKDQTDKALGAVSRLLGTSIKELKDEYKKGYIVSSLPVTIARNVPMDKVIALEVLKFDLPNIIIHPEPKRDYPYGRLAAHVMGYINEIDRWRLTKLKDFGYNTKDLVGFGGLEEKYDYYLRQEEGGLSFEIDHRGRFRRVLGFKPPVEGRDIQLTLDARVQKIAQDNLADRKGCVIIMDPYDGQIIAMASSPDFSPAVFTDKAPDSISTLFRDTNAPLLNRAISSSFPAGSIFKIVVATAALETKKITSHTSFYCPGSFFVGKKEFSCWEKHGQQELAQAIAHSCNVFFYHIGLMVGPQAIHDYALKFGFSRNTSFELPYETSGFIPSPLWRKIHKLQSWFDGDTANLSIGQGDVLITPVQAVRMIAVFANGGYLVNPYIVKAIDGRDIAPSQKRAVNLSLKKATLNNIREGLRGVVTDARGTGNVLSGLSVSVAGKTGSAQAPPGQAHAWFTGFFPYEEPKFAICVFLERGAAGYYSCVIARRIIEEMVNQGLL
ncbi:MAG: penicillin-binding protein 2 [Candidatus Omnitrophica bacterium]|nr:penicillin-binding protein 2 [Candidatus Omnitrophota bacterium]